MKYFLCVIFLLPVYCYNGEDTKQYLSYPRIKVLERFLDSLPTARQNENSDRQMLMGTDEPNVYVLQKRNNAELVNHILKNLNGLDHLGDIGRR